MQNTQNVLKPLRTKAISVKLQRRAAALPCDGVKCYKVGKAKNLTYSQARQAIITQETVAPNVLKRGTANRLAELNRIYFRRASGFVLSEVQKLQANTIEQSAPDETQPVDDGGAAGTVVSVEPAPEPVLASISDHQNAAPVSQPVERPSGMEVGTKAGIVLCPSTGGKVGTISRSKSGFTITIDGQTIRTRNALKASELIYTALSEQEWTLVP